MPGTGTLYVKIQLILTVIQGGRRAGRARTGISMPVSELNYCEYKNIQGSVCLMHTEKTVTKY